jgi:hypothetical protein
VNLDEALDRIATEETFTVLAAAAAIHVSPWTIRQWVNRGHLQPVPGFAPMVFFETDIYACQTQRRGPQQAAKVSRLAQSWRGVQSGAGRTPMSA